MVQCLELYYRQGRSQKDIATTLGVSAATVSRLLKRAGWSGWSWICRAPRSWRPA
jgi:DNA-binding transcriptional regulator LsrR (DeoR family)